MRTSLIPLLCSCVGLACGSDTTSTDAMDGGAATTGEMETGTSVGETESIDGSGSMPEPFEPYPARGVRITEVYANHGVGVPIVREGQWVEAAQRNAELIRDRNTLIRGFVAVDTDFVPREIEARLTLTYGDGREEIATRNVFIEGDSVPNDLDTNVYFIVPGELLPAGVRFQVELLELTDDWRELPEPDQVAYPPQPSWVGIEDSPMTLRVVIVPIDHDLDPQCPEPPEVTDEELQFLSEQLYMHNPVDEVVLERRDVVPYTGALTSFSGLLGFLAELREQDNADPAAYYYGVVRPCDGGADGVGGQAISIPDFPTQQNAWTRVSMGRWYSSLSSTANTFVHEVGHNQGRRHIACNGSEGGVNPSYPYPAGDIGVWGFGSIDFALRSPTSSKDYMTYCGNTWVSDWGWSRVVPFIREITGWASMDAASAEPGQVLVGLVDDAAGSETWFVTSGLAEGLAAEGVEPLVLTERGGTKTSLEAARVPMGDNGAYSIVVQLPATVALDDLVGIDALGHAVPQVRLPGRTLSLRP